MAVAQAQHALREMADAGWEIGCHSMSHPDLTKLDGDALSYEITESRKIIENEVGVPVSSFAYPFGKENELVLQRIHFANYDAAVGLGLTPNQGPDNLFYLHRRGIEWSCTLERFASFLPWTGALETPAP
jgi:peptidoglycan/xylan/chitin deacetylase (PgdA/CDA1 family)